MEPRAHHILIGLFTIVTAVALMAFALWLNKAGSDGEREAYDIVFEEDVKGLTRGSAVLYSGIAVGEVVSLHLDEQDPSKVWTRIRIDSNTPMRTTTTARMSLANITGASVILLETEDPDSPPLESRKGHVPVIPSKPSPFNQLRTSGEELLVNVSRLVNNASDLLSAENSDNVSKILANLEQTTSALAGQKEAIGDLAAAGSELRETVSRSARLLRKFNAEFEAHGGDLLEKADQSMTSLAQLSSDLSAILAENRESLSQSARGLAELGPVITRLQELIDNLNNITREFEENPGGYLLGGEKLKEYQP